MFSSLSHRRTPRTLPAIAAAAALVMASAAAHAASVTLTSTVDSSGYNGGTTSSIPLTADNSYVAKNTPWTYDADQVDALDVIEKISVNLVLGSADTDGPGSTNYNELTLALDGIDTGLKLNGTWQVIAQPGQDDIRPPLTFTGTPLNAGAILDALKDDGKLIGTILDSQPGDDFITLGSTQGGFGTTQLVLNGIADQEPGGGGGGGGTVIPLPAGVWAGIAMMSSLGAGAGMKRRLRKQTT